MVMCHFSSGKEAERALSQLRWGCSLKAKQGKVLFVPPSEHVIIQALGFKHQQVDSGELAELLEDREHEQFAGWQLYDVHKLHEEEVTLPPYPYREVSFSASEKKVAVAHDVFEGFRVSNVRLYVPKNPLEDELLKVRAYVHRDDLVRLEAALKNADVSGHCKECPLYICRDPDGPAK